MAAIPEGQFNDIVNGWRDRIEKENERVTVDLLNASKHVRGTFGTGENEWYTPAQHIELARHVLGKIDLDPASSDIANATIKASQFFTKADDGLRREWVGNVWLNPPYAQPLIYRGPRSSLAAVPFQNNKLDTLLYFANKFGVPLGFHRGRFFGGTIHRLNGWSVIR